VIVFMKQRKLIRASDHATGRKQSKRERPSHMLMLEGAIAMMLSRIDWIHSIVADLK